MQHSRRCLRTPDRQSDLFPASPPPTACVVPGWSTLPEPARRAVAVLMVPLLLAHLGSLAPESGGVADER
ncbi:hypothetical protein CTJ15_04000 (plasmid) [Roseomonas sp. FDAARGOS_362]|uniref:hypothetical protein n=1 Tax=Roseomonas sp. FDAARGOS_362 TaxID=2018065 RepID=UPI000C366578|nr:hypothetical protein [Roseomonas sp. FDAARGOS_362]ATR19531.1 hypothetical protein CTJ15_04000 [Roseomonas sp. FDAARGOS_362]